MSPMRTLRARTKTLTAERQNPWSPGTETHQARYRRSGFRDKNPAQRDINSDPLEFAPCPRAWGTDDRRFDAYLFGPQYANNTVRVAEIRPIATCCSAVWLHLNPTHVTRDTTLVSIHERFEVTTVTDGVLWPN